MNILKKYSSQYINILLAINLLGLIENFIVKSSFAETQINKQSNLHIELIDTEDKNSSLNKKQFLLNQANCINNNCLLHKNNPRKSRLFIASPENFNPELKLPTPSKLEVEPQQERQEEPNFDQIEKTTPPLFTIESITPNFRLDQDNYGQTNQIIEQMLKLRLRNGDTLSIKTGFNTFNQEEIEVVNNIPIYLGWQGEIEQLKVAIDGGIDLFDRLSPAPSLNLNLSTLVDSRSKNNQPYSFLTLSAAVKHEPYKFNAETLENSISFWRFSPSLYWQINPNLTLFSVAQLGWFSDGNQEFQTFSRLEQKVDDFTLALNLFSWSFQSDMFQQSGYFSPADFLVYNAEVAWNKEIFDFLVCRVSASVGKQRLNGSLDNAITYNALCTSKISPNIELDLGYGFSNVRNSETGDSAYNNETFTGQMRIKF